jgi:glycyl-tRNA synthetase
LLDFNNGQMPFACAQIGLAFRNEIAPRSGLLRVREFPMAEIEHFVNPDDKRHPKFKDVADLHLWLLSRTMQTGEDIAERIKVRDAVDQKIINNETLAYFMARTHLFLVECGLEEKLIRFRQHKSTEMAHYAKDCWDAEINNSYGWIECVGHADRACYDLDNHSKVAKVDLIAEERYPKPREVDIVVIKPNAAKIGKTFGKAQEALKEHLRGLEKDRAAAEKLASQLKQDGKAQVKTCNNETFELTNDMLTITFEKKSVHGFKYTPSVIEPSFGLGRILYSILENSYYVRPKEDPNDAKEAPRAVLRLSARIAPLKCSILPLRATDEQIAVANALAKLFITANLATKSDSSGASIGKRYARTDEIGVPFAITVDPDTLSKPEKPVTIRERDSTSQVIAPMNEAVSVIAQLVAGTLRWSDVTKKYPIVVRKDEEEKKGK